MKVETSCRSVRLSAPACSIHKQISWGRCAHYRRRAAAGGQTSHISHIAGRATAEPARGVIEFATAHWLAWYHGSAELIGLQIK